MRILTLPRTKNSLAGGRYAELLAQLQQFDQRVGAVEHPHLRAGDGFEDFPPPFVDRVRRRQDQGAAVTFGMEHGRDGNCHQRLARSHFRVDDCGAFTTIDQQLADCVDDFGLRGERLPLETRQNPLPMWARFPGVNRRIGAVEAFQKLVTEFGNEIVEADGQR